MHVLNAYKTTSELDFWPLFWREWFVRFGDTPIKSIPNEECLSVFNYVRHMKKDVA